MSSDSLKHRMQLWLRGERALGLSFVPRFDLGATSGPAGAANSAAPAPSPAPMQSPQTRAAAASIQPTRPAATPAPAPVQRPRPVSPPAPEASPIPSPAIPVLQAPIEGAELTREQKAALLDELNKSSVTGCTACELHKTRTKTVFGEGDPDARLVFVGEGPGKDEDASGRPFVGRAGQKLDEMIRAMGLRRDQVFICNIVKCRAFLPGPPPKDRPPSDQETAACAPRLIRQLEIIRPKVIVTLGLPATKFLLSLREPMSRMRGRWHAWRGIKVMPTWHPAYVLRNYTPETRQQVWDDLQKVMGELGIPVPNKSGKQT